MCGIVGIYDRTASGRADPNRVRAMAQAVAHRGPDGAGFFNCPESSPSLAMGVRRLSIIDLTTGDQPIFNEDRSIALVFNGEISNYLELRSDLEARGHVFRTHTDTEVVVHLYEDLGLELFPRLRGMYAFALWDGRRESLLLAVDHVGIKPLYIAEQGGRLLFASEAKALWVGAESTHSVNDRVIDTYLTFGYMIGSETLYDGIRRLPPGHALEVHGSRSQLIRHWTPPHSPASEVTAAPSTMAGEIYERLRDAIRLQLRSDVPVGLFLSGGIDSASVLALSSGLGQNPIDTFSVGYRGASSEGYPDDETERARRLAARFGARHRELRLSADDWWNALIPFISAHEEPNADPAVVSLFALSGLASAHVKVVLSGLGGDEVFGGYGFQRRIPARIRRGAWLHRTAPSLARSWGTGGAWESAEAAYPAIRRIPWIGALWARAIELRSLCLPVDEALRRRMSYDGLVFSDRLRTDLYDSTGMASSQESRHTQTTFDQLVQLTGDLDLADLVQQLWLQVWLPGSGLLGLDKVTMAHSLEARVPFFDPALMDFVLRIPPSVRLRGNKALLREAMRRDLPKEVYRRPKRPFSTPIHSWFDHELADRSRAVLLDPRCLGRGWFRPTALRDLVRSHFARQSDHTELIFRLLVFELWQQATVDPPIRIPDPSDAVPG